MPDIAFAARRFRISMTGLAEHGTAPKQGNASIMPKNGRLLNCYLLHCSNFSFALCQSGDFGKIAIPTLQ
jgi:hypothetical protein